MADDSYVKVSDEKVVAYVGPDAVRLASTIALRSAIRLYAKSGIVPTRRVTITRLLGMATAVTGKTYRRGAYEAAQQDLTTWIDAMRAAMPVIQKE